MKTPIKDYCSGKYVKLALTVLFFTLSGCASTPPLPGAGISMGDAVEAPWGFTEFCKRELTAPECGK